MDKAMRLLHERLSSKVANGVHVESNRIVSNGVESAEVSSGGLISTIGGGLAFDGLGHNGVESNSILIDSK